MSARPDTDILLQLEGLTKHFPVQKSVFEKITLKQGHFHFFSQIVHAVNGVNLTIRRGETLALVGESGCGKSTLAKTILGLHQPTAGRIFYEGQEISQLSGRSRRPFQKKIQIIFQDPFSSLNPRKKVMDIVGQPMITQGLTSRRGKKDRVLEILAKVGLDPVYANRYPHQFSGGQRQRIGIARALAAEPELVIADEPISALDVSIQAQILNLMMEMQEEFYLTYLFVTHDLSVVKHISTQVAVMYLGFIVESAETDEIFTHPRHPYTQLLFSVIPSLESLEFKDAIPLGGEVPTPINLPSGCPFHPRCPEVMEVCRQIRPVLSAISQGHLVSCHLFD